MDEALGQAFNVGSRFEHTIEELARLVLEVTGSSSELLFVPYEQAYGRDFADTRRRVPDVRKAERILGWRADRELREGLRDLLAEREAARCVS
jgi:UDP-glucose 4-epimerase